jgi:hypothetical protein
METESMSYDRFTTQNPHGLRDGERGTAGYAITPGTYFCDYKPDGEKKECGAAFKSTSPNAHSCPLHRDAARKQRASAYRKRMRAKQ